MSDSFFGRLKNILSSEANALSSKEKETSLEHLEEKKRDNLFEDTSLDGLNNRLDSIFKDLNATVDNIFSKYKSRLDNIEEELKRMEEEQARWESGSYSSETFTYKTSSQKKEYYEVLEIHTSASFDEIKKSYRRLIKIYHPDKYANDPEKHKIAQAVSLKLNEAYAYFQNIDKPKKKNF